MNRYSDEFTKTTLTKIGQFTFTTDCEIGIYEVKNSTEIDITLANLILRRGLPREMQAVTLLRVNSIRV